MAIEDSSSPNGLRLVIEDYPYAVDGLEIWNAIKTWVQDYVSLYYGTDDAVEEDRELKAWWKEVIEKGHADLKDESWWPKLQTRQELIQSCSTIIWIASALHAAVNFGQYPYGGYILNRPTLSRRLISEKGTPEYDEMVTNPQKAYLKTITPKYQTLINLSVIEILSRHTSDEVYLGQRDGSNWISNPKAVEGFKKFGKNLENIEKKISERNHDPNLRNRTGPAQLPYTVLLPTSETGLFSMVVKGRVVLMQKNVLETVTDAKELVSSAIKLMSSSVEYDITKSVFFKLISRTKSNHCSRDGAGKVGKETCLENNVSVLRSLGERREEFDIYFEWDAAEMGIPGAFYVKNLMNDEFFLASLTLEYPFPACHQNKDKNKIHFPYLPGNQTPGTLRKYREEELKSLRGDGTGQRQEWDRIYDYDVYNDLGFLDSDIQQDHPILGGPHYPYPRRVRTGRKLIHNPKNGSEYEEQGQNYVPRDEKFSHVKTSGFLEFGKKTLAAGVEPLLVSLYLKLTSNEFNSFEEVQKMYEGGITLPVSVTGPGTQNVLQFPPPRVIQESKFAWMTDEEFTREMIAGVNPCVIRLLKREDLAPRSNQDCHSNQASTITKEQLEINMGGITVDEVTIYTD
ncbi:unnamed protein product [Sphenostylis stenocarpa]|uniref:Lipoxygenase domain-containing protein n=1 Tax=Sphenostylis stenocarpa TaxID=92480 RepID=A0AA86T4X1_9FABA|nr:unnamed protein product [Sphenostylis stenocarpa]